MKKGKNVDENTSIKQPIHENRQKRGWEDQSFTIATNFRLFM